MEIPGENFQVGVAEALLFSNGGQVGNEYLRDSGDRLVSFTIATNLSLNDLRRPERKLRVDLWGQRDDEPDHEGPPLPDPAAATPEQSAAARELARDLEAAIGALPPKQRAALLLSRMDGLAYRDVGEALGCSEGAVKALLFRATHALKAQLREHM
jgi:RNA polymerase sigma-70 factor (ECF subfamily)